MADRYWVGGTGNWSDTAHWSTTSGGTSGASVPTASDNAFFNNSSSTTTFTVTVDVASNCLNFDASGITSTTFKMTFSGTVGFTVAGSWINPTSAYYGGGYNGTVTFTATTSGKTITSNGVALTNSGQLVIFNGVGGVWTLGSALTLTNGTLQFTNGTFDTSSAGNYAVTVSNMSFGAGTKVINFNGSTISTGGNPSLVNNATGATINSGTSTLTLTGVNPNLISAGFAFYNLSLTNMATGVINGSNTFNNITTSTQGSSGLASLTFDYGANNIINGLLSVNSGASDPTRRIFLRSSTVGTATTLTLNGTASLTNVDFRDVTIAGTITKPITGTSLNNCGNNSNITFTTAKTVYWNLTGGGNWYSAGWASTSGGTPALANFPLAQDTAIFNEAGASGAIAGMSTFAICSIDCSARTTAMSLALGGCALYGSLTLSSAVSITGTTALTTYAYGTQNINSAGVTFDCPITINNTSSGSTNIITNTLTMGSTRTLSLLSGTLNLSSGNLSANLFSSTGTLTRTLTIASGRTLTLSGASFTVSGSGFTTSGTGTISLTSATAKTFAGGGFTYTQTLSQDGAGTLTVTGANTFANITGTSFPSIITLPASTTTTLTSSFSLSGTSGNLATLNSSSSGTKATLSLSSGTVNISYVSIKDIAATGGATWNALLSNGNVNTSNNTGWIFTLSNGDFFRLF